MLEYFYLSQKDLHDMYMILSNNGFNRIDYPFAYTKDSDYKINLRAKNGKFDSKMCLTISKLNEEDKRVRVKDIELSQTKNRFLARATRDCCESVYNANLDIYYSESFYQNFEKVILEGLAKCQEWICKDLDIK